MSKRARKRQPTQPPPEWAELFAEHDDALTRVRMLWRRGGGRYRPLVPVNLALEDLEALDFEEWEEMEMDEGEAMAEGGGEGLFRGGFPSPLALTLPLPLPLPLLPFFGGVAVAECPLDWPTTIFTGQ